MKRILFSVLALLIFVGVAYAHNPLYDPQTTDGWARLAPVFNNAGATVSKGDVVVWDIDGSTGDDDFYITTTTTDDTGLVAGVVWPADIADQATGSIAIWGIVQCNVDATGADENSTLCTSTTAGDASSCSDAGAAFGHASVALVNGTINDCFVNP